MCPQNLEHHPIVGVWRPKRNSKLKIELFQRSPAHVLDRIHLPLGQSWCEESRVTSLENSQRRRENDTFSGILRTIGASYENSVIVPSKVVNDLVEFDFTLDV